MWSTGHRHVNCNHGARGWWPGNRHVLKVVVAGVQPLVAGVIGALDISGSRGLAGRTGAKIRIGDSADPEFSYRGYLAYQRLNAIPPGAAATLRRGPSTILPSTHGDVRTIGGTVQDHLAQVTPGGLRR